MIGSALGYTAIAVYLAGWIYHQVQVRQDPQFNSWVLQLLAATAIGLHGIAAANLLFVAGGLDLSLLKILALLALVINSVVCISGVKKPLHSLYLFLFPISILSLLAALLSESSEPVLFTSIDIQAHVLISVLAYSLLAVLPYRLF